LVLNRNPGNFFEEVEQVAFHPGHLVPGIDITDDPLLAGRLFSYLDTQISRLGGPNFEQIPVNRPHAPVNSMHRDGFHQAAAHVGVAPYKPNSLDGGCPFFAGTDEQAFIEVPVEVPAARKVREAPVSFADHFTQPRIFWLSLSPVEREHVIAAYTFELGKCYEQAIKERNLAVLAQVDPYLCEQVAMGLGLPAPKGPASLPQVQPSPALSQVGESWPVKGRIIGIVADHDSDLKALKSVRQAALDADIIPLVIAPAGGVLGKGSNKVTVQRTFATARSVEFDALLLAGVVGASADAFGARDAKAGNGTVDPAVIDPRVLLMLAETYRHAKPIAVLAGGRQVLQAAGIPAQAPGVLAGDDATQLLTATVGLLGQHRVWDRFAVPARA